MDVEHGYVHRSQTLAAHNGCSILNFRTTLKLLLQFFFDKKNWSSSQKVFQSTLKNLMRNLSKNLQLIVVACNGYIICSNAPKLGRNQKQNASDLMNFKVHSVLQNTDNHQNIDLPIHFVLKLFYARTFWLFQIYDVCSKNLFHL